MAELSEHENAEIAKANESGLPVVAFVHGLWLLPNSWDRWRQAFEAAGYATIAPGWPDDPETVEEANADPDVFAKKTLGMISDHQHEAVAALTNKPALIGHSFGGLLVQMLAGDGLSAVTVAIDPAPYRGILPLPLSALKSSSVVLKNPANHHRAVPLTFEQFQYAFANEVPEDEARELYETYAVPGTGTPIFQAASANLNPFTEDKVDSKASERGPMLVMSGEKDHTVPHAIAHAEFKKQERNEGVTEFVEMAGRGHSLTVDSGWSEVCSTALAFVQRFLPTT